MSARRTSRVVTYALVAGACAALALAGCSAGQLTQTASQVAAVPGANVTVGSIALRDLKIQYNGPEGYRPGDDAPLAVRIFNDGTEPVTLTGVTADKAEAVTLVGGPGVPARAPRPLRAPRARPPAQPRRIPEPRGQPGDLAKPGRIPQPRSAAVALTKPGATHLVPVVDPDPAAVATSCWSPDQGSYLQLTGLKEPVTPGDGGRA